MKDLLYNSAVETTRFYWSWLHCDCIESRELLQTSSPSRTWVKITRDCNQCYGTGILPMPSLDLRPRCHAKWLEPTDG